MKREQEKDQIAAAVWRRLFGFFVSTRPQRDLVLERLCLTPNDAKALTSLDRHRGKTMRALAEEWICDPSNATWMVDRLERRGLAERRAVPSDRRVKLVVLTEAGARTQEALLAGMNEPPPELLVLDRAVLEALLALLERLPVGPAVDSSGPGTGAELPSPAIVRTSDRSA